MSTKSEGELAQAAPFTGFQATDPRHSAYSPCSTPSKMSSARFHFRSVLAVELSTCRICVDTEASGHVGEQGSSKFNTFGRRQIRGSRREHRADTQAAGTYCDSVHNDARATHRLTLRARVRAHCSCCDSEAY